MKEIDLSCYSVQSCGGHFSTIIFIDAKTKYRSSYLLDVSQPDLQNHIRKSLGRPQDVSEGHPQDVGKTLSLELNIRLYGGVLRTLHWDVLRTSYLKVLRTSVEDFGSNCPLELHRGLYGDVHRTSFRDVVQKSLARNFAKWELGRYVYTYLATYASLTKFSTFGKLVSWLIV